MLCNDGLQDVKEPVVLGKRVRCGGKLGGSADGKFRFGRRVREEGEDMAVEGSVVWKDILIPLAVGDAASIGETYDMRIPF